MGVSNLDEVVIVTRAKEHFEYRRGGHHHCCANESNLSQRRYTGTYLRTSRKEKRSRSAEKLQDFLESEELPKELAKLFFKIYIYIYFNKN